MALRLSDRSRFRSRCGATASIRENGGRKKKKKKRRELCMEKPNYSTDYRASVSNIAVSSHALSKSFVRIEIGGKNVE